MTMQLIGQSVVPVVYNKSMPESRYIRKAVIVAYEPDPVQSDMIMIQDVDRGSLHRVYVSWVIPYNGDMKQWQDVVSHHAKKVHQESQQSELQPALGNLAV